MSASFLPAPSLVVALATALIATQTPPFDSPFRLARDRPAQDAPKPDSPEVRQLLERAAKNAGSEWKETFDFMCALNPSRGSSPDDPAIEPTRVFDNLYVIGRTSAVVWAVTTSEGTILIDSGYAGQVESVLLSGMKMLGLDPARVRYVFLGHGHADHFGGAPYFQQRGARVVMMGPDWDLVEKPAAGRGGPQPPTREVVAVEGQAIRVGDVAFTPVMIPGHTAGSMGLVFPVKDGQTTRMAGLFGGSILIPSRIPDAGLEQYIRSIEHWGEVTRRLKVDVEIQNHPLYDGFLKKLEQLKTRRAGASNPFVVGPESYQRFLGVMSDCTKVQMARRKSV